MTYNDFVSVYGEFSRAFRLLRYSGEWGGRPYPVSSGLLLLTGHERERVDSGVETSRTMYTAFWASKGLPPIEGDIIEGAGYGYRIEEIRSIDQDHQVYELRLLRFTMPQ